jgi:GWxTD domain-containing protein
MKSIFFLQAVGGPFIALVLFAQSVPARGLNVSFDYATFRYDSARTYAELYYSFSSGGLDLIRIPLKDSAESYAFADSLLLEVSIRTVGSDSAVARQIWRVPVVVTDTTQGSLRKTLVGKIDFVLLPGNYRLKVYCSDRNDSLSRDSLSADLAIPSYASDKLESSEVELCSNITQGESGSLFYKNTYNVVPNPSATYGIGLPIIYYYLEIYNIPEVKSDTFFTTGYEIRDGFGQIRKSLWRTRKKFGSSSVEVGTVNGSNLRTGTYTFIYTVADSAANLFATSSKRFFIYNPGLGKPESPDTSMMGSAVLSSAFASMGEEQLDKEFGEARYISTSSQRDQYEKLSGVDSKRQFMYDFWKSRVSLEGSARGDIRTRYLQRVAYANDHFRAGLREGWKTDRGRVYIMYGPPDEIDRHPNETSSKPYEIWYYNSIEGGVTFDFVDRTGFGDYSLVNSTERSEIHDDNWQQYLSQ